MASANSSESEKKLPHHIFSVNEECLLLLRLQYCFDINHLFKSNENNRKRTLREFTAAELLLLRLFFSRKCCGENVNSSVEIGKNMSTLQRLMSERGLFGKA